MKLVTLKTYHSSLKAHHDRIRLENEGIPCVIFDEQSVQTVPLYDLAVGGMSLSVREEDVVDALGILSQSKQYSDIEDDALQCPKCHSTRVKTKWSLKYIMTNLLSLLFMTGPKGHQPTYKCSRCGNEFKMEVS